MSFLKPPSSISRQTLKLSKVCQNPQLQAAMSKVCDSIANNTSLTIVAPISPTVSASAGGQAQNKKHNTKMIKRNNSQNGMCGYSSRMEDQIPKDAPIEIPNRKKYGLVDFMMKFTDEVINDFARLPNAQLVGVGQKRFVYIPGTRKDKVLLVAHADTVFGESTINLGKAGEFLFSTNTGTGIGADDRCGIAMLWKLKDLGHSILVPNAEESGCIGSRFLMEHEEWRKIINSHQFAIEMDRMHGTDLVFYNVGSEPFKLWCENQFSGYERAHGSFTDISVLCDSGKHKEDCLDGLNISVGYYGQHGDSEYVDLKEFQRTLSSLYRVLSQPNMPKFAHKYTPHTSYTNSSHNSCNHHNYNNSSNYQYDRKGFPTTGDSKSSPDRHNYNDDYYRGINNNNQSSNNGDRIATNDISSEDILKSIMVCPKCDAIMDESECLSNGKKCIYCIELMI